MLKLIAREWDAQMPSSDAWHKELMNQMSAATSTRPAVLSSSLVEILSEFLAFRHLFRGASILLMRWEKLAPLVARVSLTYEQTEAEIHSFIRFLDLRNAQELREPRDQLSRPRRASQRRVKRVHEAVTSRKS